MAFALNDAATSPSFLRSGGGAGVTANRLPLERKQEQQAVKRRRGLMIGGVVTLIGFAILGIRRHRLKQRKALLDSEKPLYLRDAQGNFLAIGDGGKIVLSPTNRFTWIIRPYRDEYGVKAYTVTSATPIIDSQTQSVHMMNLNATEGTVTLTNIMTNDSLFTFSADDVMGNRPYYRFVNKNGIRLGSLTGGVTPTEHSVIGSRDNGQLLTPISLDDLC